MSFCGILFIQEVNCIMCKEYTAEELRKARNEYYRQWRKKNPEKVKAAQLRYWMRKLEESKKNKLAALPEDIEYR